MKSAIFSTLALGALSVLATPVKRAPTDTDILNYALTLEHLENAFYKGGLATYNQAAFKKAGFPAFVRNRFEEIAEHEASHVSFLQTALGKAATAPCEYKFPYTDPKSFAALSATLEGVGVSAYLGAAALITNPAYLTAAGSILTTESRHASWVAGAVNKVNSWSGSYDVPLSLDEVYTLAAQFITSCPTTNPALPVKAFPALTFPTSAKPGKATTATFKAGSGDQYIAFYSGLTQKVVKVGSNGAVTIPEGLEGTVYAVATTNSTTATDDNIVAGPAILNFAFNSDGTLV